MAETPEANNRGSNQVESRDIKNHPIYIAAGSALAGGTVVAMVFLFFIDHLFIEKSDCLTKVEEKKEQCQKRVDGEKERCQKRVDDEKEQCKQLVVEEKNKAKESCDRLIHDRSSEPGSVYPDIKSARIRGIGPISPGLCTSDNPCNGLRRQKRALHVELTQAGYAAVFLQDQSGKYYNQEGRLVLNNSTVGYIGLWPGTDKNITDEVFTLWIVVSDSPFGPTSDSRGLDALPTNPSRRSWGPVYLSVARN